MIINHNHVFPEGVFDKNNPKSGTVDELVEWTNLLGAEQAVAFPAFTSSEARPFVTIDSNKWLYETLKTKGLEDKIIGFAVIDPKKGWEAIQLLAEYVNKGFKGVKLHPPIYKFKVNDPLFEGFYSAAEKLRVPLIFHTGTFRNWRLDYYMPLTFDEVAQNHPELPIIMAHVGGPAFFHQALAVLQNNPNCYAGISSAVRKSHVWYIGQENMMLLIKTIGSNRIIYGCDGPYGGFDLIKQDIQDIKNLPIKEEDKNNILGETLRRLIQGIRVDKVGELSPF